jgi:Na+-driven multidrug efflux pump
MVYGMAASFMLGCIMGWAAYFHGDLLGSIFSRDAAVIAASWDYLRAYAVDTLLVAFLFCFIGYFNGCGSTAFCMVQGVIGAFCVRIPVSWLVSQMANVTLFKIGLATPCSTVVQILICGVYFAVMLRREKEKLKNKV